MSSRDGSEGGAAGRAAGSQALEMQLLKTVATVKTQAELQQTWQPRSREMAHLTGDPQEEHVV